MNPKHTDQHHDDLVHDVITWFRANDVDTSRLPRDPDASIANGQLTFRQHVLSELTHTPMLDPEKPNQLATKVVTVPLLVEPPPDVAEWLRPKCPTCGR
jgi:hypothetical protein